MWTTRCGVRGTLLTQSAQRQQRPSNRDEQAIIVTPLNSLSRLELGAERARPVGAEHPHLAREESSSSMASLTSRSSGMALDIGIEHGGVERAFELIGLELGHVDAVGGEAAERLVERGRNVAHAEHEAGDDRPSLALACSGFAASTTKRVVLCSASSMSALAIFSP